MLKSYRAYIKLRVKNLWLYENLRYLPVIFLIQVLLFIPEILTIILNKRSFSNAFDIKNLLLHLEFILIPFCVINTVFVFEKKWKQQHNNNSSNTLLKLLGTVIGIIIGTAFVELLYAFNGIVDDDYIGLGEIIIDPVTTNFITNVFMGLLIAIPLFVRQAKSIELQLQLKEKELLLNQVEQLKTQARLETLQAKINPHFLYNSLNAVAGLIHDEPDKAEKMVLALSDLFRYSLNTQGNVYATITEEMEMVETYLLIEKTRFEEQLSYVVDIDPGCLKYYIPRFLMQPLVENAIKHGTSKMQRGELNISIKKNDEGIIIVVADNGPSFPQQMPDGHGIKSLYEKLNLLFAQNYEVCFFNLPQKSIQVTISQLKTSAYEI